MGLTKDTMKAGQASVGKACKAVKAVECSKTAMWSVQAGTLKSADDGGS
jgi:hypothetical protein